MVNQHVPWDIPPCHILTLRRAYASHNESKINYKIEIKCLNILQIFILSVGVITLLWLSCLYLYNHVRYVCFTTKLRLLSKKITCNEHFVSPIFSSLLALVLLVELENTQILLFVVLMNPILKDVLISFLNSVKLYRELFLLSYPFICFMLLLLQFHAFLCFFCSKSGLFRLKKMFPFGCLCYSFECQTTFI